MWDMLIANPFGRLSTRKFLSFVTTMLVAIFASSLLTAPTTHAADANWNGASITYSSNQYIASSDAKAGDSRGFAPGTKVYAYVETPQSGSGVQIAHFIYFEPPSDPATASLAKSTAYDFTPPDTFTNPTPATTISITPQSASSGGANGTTSCDSTFTFGIGWIVCPVTNFLSGAMDWLFSILSSFLTVQPLKMTQDNSLYRAWSFMRNFANIAFVIGFLIIIYSQITNAGLSNYGVKRIMPRIIIAAILVNVSYFLCTIAIDISNIFGYSLQSVFISLRNGLVGSGGNGWDVVSWKSTSGFILSGGTALAAGGIGAFSLLAGTVGGAIYLLLPILVGALMAVLVALIVMAARQAIIIVLVILAPLAFVAYLLPNTEKYFDKWKELFLTMLIMFPAFSLVFGGSQLAGTAIIHNADSINLILLGMAVQIAPVAITPLLLRFSGSLLGKFSGMLNNPKRGMVDRTRNWSKERADQHKARVIANAGPRRRDVLARRARSIDTRRRAREGWHKANESTNDNNFHASPEYQALDMANRDIERTKKLIESEHEIHWNTQVRLDRRSLEKELTLRVSMDEESATKARLDTIHEEFKAGHYPTFGPQNLAMSSLMAHSDIVESDLALTALRKQSAERKSKTRLTESLLENTGTIDGVKLREYAGGVQGVVGANTVLAAAIAASRKEFDDKVGEKSQLISHFNLSGGQRQSLAMTGIVSATDSKGHSYTFDGANDIYAVEAAIEAQLGGQGNMENIEQIISNSGSVLSEYRTTISKAVSKNRIADKAAYLGGKTIDDIAQGLIRSDADLNAVATRAVAQGKVKPTQIANMDKDSVQRIYNVAITPDTSMISPADVARLADEIQNLKVSAQNALSSPALSGNIAQNAKPIIEMIRDM
jgi:hypothetical protein